MRRARAEADDHARRHGWSRRRFLLSSSGMVAGLAALESCSRDRSRSTGTERGGTFNVPESAVTDPDEAATTVHGVPPPPTQGTAAPPSTTTPLPADDFVV